jgi:hypothetical protein
MKKRKLKRKYIFLVDNRTSRQCAKLHRVLKDLLYDLLSFLNAETVDGLFPQLSQYRVT